MHLFIHLVILFIFVYALLMLNIPQIEENSYIKMKMYLFFGVFVFEFIVNIIIALFQRCIINVGKIARDSLFSALVAIVGYSVYNDLIWSSNSLINDQVSNATKKLTITTIIIAFISLGYFMEIMFSNSIPGINDCLNNIYREKK